MRQSSPFRPNRPGCQEAGSFFDKGKGQCMRFAKILIAVIAVCSASVSATNVGDTAPVFSLSTYGGGTFDLAQQRGKVTVLVFLCCP